MWPDSAVNYQFRIRINYNEAKDAPVVGDYLQFDNWTLTPMWPTGVNNFNSFDFDIYPNPASEVVPVAKELEGAKTLSVFNMVGKEVLRKPVFELQSVLDVSSLEPGIYMLRITDGVRKRTRTLSIQSISRGETGNYPVSLYMKDFCTFYIGHFNGSLIQWCWHWRVHGESRNQPLNHVLSINPDLAHK